jgi:phosphatidylserine decarboxylase
MPEPLKQWLRREQARFDNVSDRDMHELYFHRDPTRAINHDPSLLLSPADGVILYTNVCLPRDTIDVKGNPTTIAELMEGHWVPDTLCLVIGIFMTWYHVHINRTPTKGLLYYQELPAIQTQNLPMLFAEDDLLRGALGRALRDGGFQKFNARTVNRLCLVDSWRDIFIVQIADSEVNVIAPFTAHQGWLYLQGQRFGVIRGGSQVNLIVPGISLEEIGAQCLVPAGMCIEAGEPLVRLF